jgi:hemerythrin-like metal-binding protein
MNAPVTATGLGDPHRRVIRRSSMTSVEAPTEPLPWNESFSVGNRELDAGHRQMVALINQICCAVSANFLLREHEQLLRELETLTEMHFEHEEIVLEGLYAAMPEDRLTLRAMVAASKVEHVVEPCKMVGDLSDILNMKLPSFGAAAGPKLCEELKAWFIEHAIGYDAPMKTIIQSV